MQNLIQSDLPVITIDHVFDNRSAVLSDNVNGMEELVEYICSMGHERVAYIHGADSSVSRNRISSFYRTMAKQGINVPDAYICEAQYRDTEATRRLTLELLDLQEPPTCIIYPDDFSALGGINAIRERGLSIPDDISIAGYDGILLSHVLEPKLTTICQDTAGIGKTAADRLIQEIEHPRTSLIEHVVVKGRLQKGGSVKKIG